MLGQVKMRNRNKGVRARLLANVKAFYEFLLCKEHYSDGKEI